MENVRKAAIQAQARAEMLNVLIKALAPTTVSELVEQQLIDAGTTVPTTTVQKIRKHLHAVQKSESP